MWSRNAVRLGSLGRGNVLYKYLKVVIVHSYVMLPRVWSDVIHILWDWVETKHKFAFNLEWIYAFSAHVSKSFKECSMLPTIIRQSLASL